VDKCRNDPKARRDYLNWSNEGLGGVGTNNLVTCGDCVHFGRIRSLNEPSRQHPNLGHCAKGKPEAIAGMWDTDQRYCERFLPTNDEPG